MAITLSYTGAMKTDMRGEIVLAPHGETACVWQSRIAALGQRQDLLRDVVAALNATQGMGVKGRAQLE